MKNNLNQRLAKAIIYVAIVIAYPFVLILIAPFVIASVLSNKVAKSFDDVYFGKNNKDWSSKTNEFYLKWMDKMDEPKDKDNY